MKRTSSDAAAVTPAEIEQTAIAQGEFLEVIKRLVREGFDWRCVLSGGGMAIAEMVGGIAGPGKVSAHFAQLAALTMPPAAEQKH